MWFIDKRRNKYFVSNWYEKKIIESADSKLIHCKRDLIIHFWVIF